MHVNWKCALLGVVALGCPAQQVGRTQVLLTFWFDQEPSDPVLREVQRELSRVLRSANLEVSYRMVNTRPAASGEGVLLHFTGNCRAIPGPEFEGEMVMARTVFENGQAHQETQVDCEQVKQAVAHGAQKFRFALTPGLLGRGLARSAAHELYHIFANTVSHGTSGIAKPSLTGRDLIEPGFSFARRDLDSIRNSELLRSSPEVHWAAERGSSEGRPASSGAGESH
jgi:hypothetical protein